MAADSFTLYLRDLGRYPLLDKNQEILLARQVQTWLHDPEATPRQKKAGKRAYEKLIKCNLRLVVSIAKRSATRVRRSELIDIVQEGNCGLAHGIKKFDPERGYALSTYVYWWIRQSISRYLCCNDRLIRLPAHAVEMMIKLKVWTPKFLDTHGRMPTLQECAEFCKTTPDRMRLYMDNAHDSVSLDATVSKTEDKSTLLDLIASDCDLMEDLDFLVRGDFLAQLIDSLEPLEQRIVSQYYALDGGEPLTLAAIGKELGVTRESVRMRLNRSLLKMKAMGSRCSAL